jgi:hypothetical protein
MNLTAAPAWQADRAAKLHAEFTAIAAAVEHEGAPLVKSLEECAARLDGTALKSPSKPRFLRASLGTLTRAYYAWQAGGRRSAALLPGYKSPAHVQRLPDPLAAEIQKIATASYGGRDKHQKGINATDLHKELTRRWKRGEALPGVGTWREWWSAARPGLPAPQAAPDFPWSVKTVCRRMGPLGLLKLGNLGVAAALKHHPHMRRDYSQLRKGELYTLDDVRLDLVALDDLTGRTVSVTCYILQEIGSRCIVAFILKPSDAIKAEDVDELLAWGLQAEGFGIGVGYQTHIWFERGSVACSEAAQHVLEAGSDGAIKVHRTSMDQGVKWIGSAADKASGHSAGKATIESFNKKLHARLLHLKGQRGNTRDNQPANLGVGDAELADPSRRRAADTLRSEADRLGQFRTAALLKGQALDLKLPLLLVSQLQQEVATVIRAYNGERGHHMQGFHKITEAEIAPGVWQQVGTF